MADDEAKAELIDALFTPMREDLRKAGITFETLAEVLATELKATQSKVVKIKGALKVKRGVKVLGVSGVIEAGQDGEREFGDGETLAEIERADWAARHRAADASLKLLNAFPAEKVEHKVEPVRVLAEIPQEQMEEIKRAARVIAAMEIGRAHAADTETGGDEGPDGG